MDDLLVPLGAGCALALASALAVVLARRPVYAAMALLAHSLSLAGLFAVLGASLVAVGQVLIYSGAIVVLFLFVVTLLPTGGKELGPSGSRLASALVGGGAMLAALLAAAAGGIPLARGPEPAGVEAVGRSLFLSPLVVAFELTAPLLLAAIVGAVVIWRRHEPARSTPGRTKETGPRTLVLHE